MAPPSPQRRALHTRTYALHRRTQPAGWHSHRRGPTLLLLERRRMGKHLVYPVPEKRRALPSPTAAEQ
ncbi:hypothetical protein E2C01_087737 [Portunus trituberculatus]|uniref:Uncharacterized protein n=1 Tax=Portunus trituberculatus TaxID=210409 RepID=A0A5B7JEW3_PORTR|nr:hypothetical protein [Portunus trituberculatus]